MKTILRACSATVAFAILHSFLASSGAKRLAVSMFGTRKRNGLYRPFYLLQSLASLGILVVYIRSLPRVRLYRFCGAPALAMRAGQAAGPVWAVLAAWQVGIGAISGWSGLRAWIRGGEPAPEPEAQGPARDRLLRMRATGPFRLSRHPLNLAPLPVMWLYPEMTTRLLGFNLAATLYLVIGSWHEERRLEGAYGTAYGRYRRSGVPFFLPRP